MSGHSKWANIKHKKDAADKVRGKAFSRLGKEIMVAAKMGGADPNANPKLRSALAAAKAVNMPNVNIDRAIKKGMGELGDVTFEEIVYEGYAAGGVAVIVECLTDNRNRTVADVRHYFDKYGGNLGTSGSVSWQFTQKGVLVIDGEDLDEETVMMQALDAGAADFDASDGVFEVYTEPDDFDAVKDALAAQGLEFMEAQVEMVPQTYIKLTDEDDIKNMTKMLELMDDNDDIQNVWHNWDQDE